MYIIISNAQREMVWVTEVLEPTGHRAMSEQMQEAKRAEIRNLLDRGTFKVILKEEVPPEANILPGPFS